MIVTFLKTLSFFLSITFKGISFNSLFLYFPDFFFLLNFSSYGQCSYEQQSLAVNDHFPPLVDPDGEIYSEIDDDDNLQFK